MAPLVGETQAHHDMTPSLPPLNYIYIDIAPVQTKLWLPGAGDGPCGAAAARRRRGQGGQSGATQRSHVVLCLPVSDLIGGGMDICYVLHVFFVRPCFLLFSQLHHHTYANTIVVPYLARWNG